MFTGTFGSAKSSRTNRRTRFTAKGIARFVFFAVQAGAPGARETARSGCFHDCTAVPLTSGNGSWWLIQGRRRGDRRSQAALRRRAGGENLEQCGGLPLCGGLTLVFKGQSATIGKSTTLMRSQGARWRIVSPMPHASSSRYQAAAGR